MTEVQMLASYARQDGDTVVKFLHGYSTWRNLVKRQVKFFGGTPEDYEEIYNETIVAFNTAMLLKRFRGDANLKTYFLSISENKCKKMLEKREKERRGMEGYTPIAAAMRAEEIYGPQWRDRYEKLRGVLQGLSQRDRKLVQLIMAGWQHQDIAPEIGLRNADTSKATFHRVKNFIKRVMKAVAFFLFLN